MQFFKDLNWALSSANLLQHTPPELSGQLVSEAATQQLLQQLDHQTEPPMPARRLGLYFEQLIGYALAHQPNYQLLAHNLAIFKKQQLGALDFVFEHQQQFYHWELAVKFYLYYTPDQHWYGPNAQDLLALKLQRLFGHQLPLAQHPQVQARFQAPLHSAALIRGYLFYHWQSPTPALADWINPHHLRGWWCYIDELAACLEHAPTEHRWQILPRANWLNSAQNISPDDTFTIGTIIQQIQQKIAPPLVVELAFNGEHWQEASRGFVVPTSWPQHAGFQL